MLASELIAKLSEIIEQDGDMPVQIPEWDRIGEYLYFASVHSVDVNLVKDAIYLQQ